MQWFRRPHLALYAPRRIVTGRPFELEVGLEASRPTVLREVRVDLVATYWVALGRQSQKVTLFQQRATAGQGLELDAPSTVVHARLEIPTSIPGTYSGELLKVKWAVMVRAVVPGWFDRVGRFSLRVDSGATPEARNEHLVFVSDPEGPGEKRPYLEVTLGTTVVQPGETISFAAAFANVAHNRYTGLEVALIAAERAGTQRSTRAEARWHVPLDGDLVEGRAIERQIQLPRLEQRTRSFRPGFETPDIALSWHLRIRGTIAWRRAVEVWIPITVAHEPVTGDMQVLAHVGNERVDVVWHAVARATNSSYEHGVLRFGVGNTSVQVERVVRDGPRVIRATVGFPHLGIGLALHVRRFGWSRSASAVLAARDPVQRAQLDAALSSVLANAHAVSASDEAVVCELGGAGYRERPIVAFVQRVRKLAEALEYCRRELSFPSTLAAEAANWERAAQALEGVLERAAPRIVAAGVDCSIEIGVEWSDEGAPAARRVIVAARHPMGERHRGQWAASDANDWRQNPPAEVRALLATAERVEVEESGAHVWFALGVSIESVATEARELARWVGAVTTRTGPYR